MKRCSISLLSRLTRLNSKTSVTPLLTRDYHVSDPSSPSSSSSSIHSSSTHLNKPCAKTPALFIKPRFLSADPSRNTLVEIPPPSISPRQRKLRDKSQLEDALESAETTDEMLKVFQEMEASFHDRDLGLPALKVGLQLDQDQGVDPQTTLAFATKALQLLDRDEDSSNTNSFYVSMALQLIGSVYYRLKRFSDSLGYLSRANRMLVGLAEDGNADNIQDILPLRHAVLAELANVKTAIGRREEALENLRACLDIKGMILDKDSKEFGVANRDLAEAYVAVLNFKEALPFALKALEIHLDGLGKNSVEVAHDRRLLGVIYSGLEEHEKALEQNELSQKVLRNWGLSADLLRAEIDAANMQIALGKYDEAIGTLKGIVQQTEKDSENRALVFISMGKALSSQEKFTDAKKCLDIARGVLEKKEKVSPVEVAEAYSEIAMQYENMNEFENAISLLKRTLSLVEKVPQEQHSEGSISARIGWLLLLTGRVTQAIPYLENAAERLKESFGPKHFGVGYIYNNLGSAYMELDRPQSAAQMFAVAKDIMDAALGPHHADSIESCQNLSKAYATMKNYVLAIEFQQRVVDAWESHGINAKDELEEARQQLEQLEMKVLTESMEQRPRKALPPHQSDPCEGNLQPQLPQRHSSTM
ncbi:Protein KINESIN LIGHT CHAIN-RELATED 2 [Linum perenne]